MDKMFATPIEKKSSSALDEVSDTDRKVFKARLTSISTAVKQQAVNEFNQMVKHFLQALYTALKKRRPHIQACMNSVAVALAGGNPAVLIQGFDKEFSKYKELIETRNEQLFYECKDWEFMKALDVEETWPKMPMKLKNKIWQYILELNCRKDIYAKPDVTDEEVDQLIRGAQQKIRTFAANHGHVPTNPEQLMSMGMEVGKDLEDKKRQQQQ